MTGFRFTAALTAVLACCQLLQAQPRGRDGGQPSPRRQLPGTSTEVQVTEPGFKVFQFPRTAIPRIDGEFSDWDIVPDSYAVTIEEMWDDSGKHPAVDKSTLDIKVKVGWVEGLNRLYFYYEAYDDYWDFDQLGLRNDTFEIVVDGDLSGGPHIDEFRLNAEAMSRLDAFFSLQNVHAQNYHIMTPPAPGKSWTMAWGTQQWLKELPYANYAYDYDFKHGEDGTLRFEFYITPFDFASPEGPAKSVESKLYEGKKIGLCWAVIDYDGGPGNNGFWNLSAHHRMFGNASMERLRELEREGKVFVIAPDTTLGVGRTETDTTKLRQLYDEGMRIAQERMDALREYLA